MLEMSDFDDDSFGNIVATRSAQSGDYNDSGLWVAGVPVVTTHNVTMQPLSESEISNLGEGGERDQDYRKIYINSGDLFKIEDKDEWTFDTLDLSGVKFRTFKLDSRPLRNYCKCIVARIDE